MQRVFRPCDKLAPVVLGLLPEDLDHVEFGAVGRQIAKEGVVFGHPAQKGSVFQAVMDASVIQHDEGGCWLGDGGQQAVDECHESFPVDCADDLLVMQPLASEIQGPHHRDALMGGGRHRMRLPHRRPGALHRWRGREPGLIVIDQLTATPTRPDLETGKFFLAGGESYGVTVFFRLNRVRLKLKPLARSLVPSVASEQGSRH